MTYLCKALRHIWQEYLLAREFGTLLLDFLIPVQLAAYQASSFERFSQIDADKRRD